MASILIITEGGISDWSVQGDVDVVHIDYDLLKEGDVTEYQLMVQMVELSAIWAGTPMQNRAMVALSKAITAQQESNR
jgi:hypothetical protein